ncbi:hypothetical protein ABPG75_008239 [Micractinium tetrahymenae]
MELHDSLGAPVVHGSSPPRGRQMAPHGFQRTLSAPPDKSPPRWEFGQLPSSLGPASPEQQQQALLARLQAQQLKLQQLKAEQEAWAAAARAVLARHGSERQHQQQAVHASTSSSVRQEPTLQHSTSSSGQTYLACGSLPSTPLHSLLPPAAAVAPASCPAKVFPRPESLPLAGPAVQARQSQQAQQAAKAAALQQVIGKLRAEILELDLVEKDRQADVQRQIDLAAELAKQREWELKRRQWEEEQARYAACLRQGVQHAAVTPALPVPAPAALPVPGSAAERQHRYNERQAAAAFAAPPAAPVQPQPWDELQTQQLTAWEARHVHMHQLPLPQQPQLQPAPHGEVGEQQLFEQRGRLQRAWLQLQAGQPPLPQSPLTAASSLGPETVSSPFWSCPARLSGPVQQQAGFVLQAEQLPLQGEARKARRDPARGLLAAPTDDMALSHQPGQPMSLDLQAAPSFEIPDLLELLRELGASIGLPAAEPEAPGQLLAAAAPSDGESAGTEGAASGASASGGSGGGLEFPPPPPAVRPAVQPAAAAAQQGWWAP